MSGKPAARLGDGTATGGPIVQGSATVLIGSGGGVACSACPGGLAVGNPVNPQLGAKVLSNETDIALPGLFPFILSRSYSSYQTDTPAPVGYFGPGWQGSFDISLLLNEDDIILNDSTGRSISFEPLIEGEITYSRSEGIWLMRCGGEPFDSEHRLCPLWQTLPDDVKNDPHLYLVCNNPLGPWWILGYTRPLMTEQSVLPQPLSARRLLAGLSDRFGRSLSYRRQLGGELHGQITEVVDGNGRTYRLELGVLSDEQQVFTRQSVACGWGQDNAIRLMAVYLTHDPNFPDLPAKPLVRYEYGKRGELIKVYERSGQPVREFGYHTRLWGRMVAHRLPEQADGGAGPVSRYEYNKQGKVIAQYNEGGLDYQFAYQDNQTIVTDSLGRSRHYHFKGDKGLSRLIKLQQPDGTCQYNEFDSCGRLTAQRDTLGRRTEYEIDVATGNLTAIYAPDGLKTEFYYNLQGQLTDTVYPNGSSTQQAYDELGRLVSETDVFGNSTEYRYPDKNSPLAIEHQDANGGVQQMAWDNLGQLIAYTDCSGYQTRYVYDRWGQLTELQQEETLTRRQRYSDKGQLIQSENNIGELTDYHYNSHGQLTTITYPDGSQMQMQYNRQGLLTGRQFAGLNQQFAYDVAGRLTQITNENGANYTFDYDVMDRLSEEIAFDGRSHTYRYNASGLLSESHDNGLATFWLYDHSDRLVKRQFAGAAENTADETQLTEEHWQYDPFGQLIAVSHQSQGYDVTVEYCRDKGGRIIAESQTVKNNKGECLWYHRAEQQYDKLGLPVGQQLKGLDNVEWQTYGSGHLIGVKVGKESIIEFERDRLHREVSRRFGNSQLQHHYDKLGRLSAMALSAQYPQSSRYHYDKRGQLVTIHNNKGEYHYHYDNAGRIRETRTPYSHQGFLFDPAGNRTATLTDDLMRQTRSFWPDNRITEDERYIYRYDHVGNLTERQDKRHYDNLCRYHYDTQQRLIHFSKGYGLSQIDGRYIYDPFGRRVAKVTSQANGGKPQTTWYGWQGDNLVLTEQHDTLIHTIYEPGSFVPLLRIERQRQPELQSLADKLQTLAGGQYHPSVIERLDLIEDEIRNNALTPHHQQWLTEAGFDIPDLINLVEPVPGVEQQIHLYHCDHLGTPVALINPQGQADWQAELDIWGNLLSEENPKQLYQPIRLQGQHYDHESGLHYNRYRYYNPNTGRYITQDPIGLQGGMNFYSYPTNPVQYIDPFGLSGILEIHSSGSGLLGGHSWIKYTQDGGVAITYGTWGNNPTGMGNGLFENLELGQVGEAYRTTNINDVQEQILMDLINQYKDKGADAWKLGSPCSSFSRDAWNTTTGEVLNSNILWGFGPISNPESLKKSIIKANGGVTNGVMTNPKSSGSTSIGSIGRSSGSSLNSSGSSLK